MTRKDYELIAGVLSELGSQGVYCFDTKADQFRIAEAFAKRLARENERFDRERFVKAATTYEF